MSEEDPIAHYAELPTLKKTISTVQSKWMRLMKEGGCIKRLWVPSKQSGKDEILPFGVWFTLREYLLSVLKGIN